MPSNTNIVRRSPAMVEFKILSKQTIYIYCMKQYIYSNPYYKI